jgi:hypothetical protein
MHARALFSVRIEHSRMHIQAGSLGMPSQARFSARTLVSLQLLEFCKSGPSCSPENLVKQNGAARSLELQEDSTSVIVRKHEPT